MRFESEVVAEELLPAVRSILAGKLKDDYGFNQEEIADILDVTQPAVSQYLNSKRADQSIVSRLQEDPQTGILLNDMAQQAAKEEKYVQELQQLVTTVRDKGMMKEAFSDAERII
ncbi:MAG: transcriptional regulator [Candidatus Nanohalobium sp.]